MKYSVGTTHFYDKIVCKCPEKHAVSTNGANSRCPPEEQGRRLLTVHLLYSLVNKLNRKRTVTTPNPPLFPSGQHASPVINCPQVQSHLLWGWIPVEQVTPGREGNPTFTAGVRLPLSSSLVRLAAAPVNPARLQQGLSPPEHSRLTLQPGMERATCGQGSQAVYGPFSQIHWKASAAASRNLQGFLTNYQIQFFSKLCTLARKFIGNGASL